MTLTESDLSELLDALRAGEVTRLDPHERGVVLQAADRGRSDRGASAPRRTSGPRRARTQRNGHRPRLLSTQGR